ncbi:MAG: hypothetical protein QE487_13295 [Fluviicola sp.]|nr:hypothetical protein [Fluviicola sp.]
MRFLKLIPVALFALLILLTAGWIFLDWHFTTLLPYFIGLNVMFVSSIPLAVSPKGITRSITGSFFVLSVVLSLLLLTNVSDIRSIWELLAQTGLIGIQLYLYLLARSSQLIKGKLAAILAVPFIASACSVGFSNLLGTSLTIAWWSLFIALLLAIVSLLFGFRKKQIT